MFCEEIECEFSLLGFVVCCVCFCVCFSMDRIGILAVYRGGEGSYDWFCLDWSVRVD